MMEALMPAGRDRASAGSAGFSVVEALVALFVFALAAVALMQLQTQSVDTFSRVETRALASIVAQNKLVDSMVRGGALELGVQEGEEKLGGRVWRWRIDVERTGDPATLHVQSRAFGQGRQNALADVSAYMVVGAPR
jgi:general secretion pathway protein I